MNVLVVDDDEVYLELLRQTLEASGHQVIQARNGRQALEILRRGDCRVVISDWEMPEMDGLTLCRTIRKEDLAGYVYVLLLTAHNDQGDLVTGLSAGADEFLHKPFNPAELAARMRAAERIVSLETRDVAIFAMAKLAESRDPETGAHLERVRSYCRLLAQNLAATPKFDGLIDAEFIRLIYMTSPLHDIGKVGIPDSVLLKPGRLSDREFAIMKQHAQLGADTLDAALRKFPGARFLEMARDIALTHHERFDGTGYPQGLVGEDIPLAGRIMALADVYDALTTKRVYKAAFTHEIAYDIITKEAGTHFDPDLVASFVQLQPQFIAIRDTLDRSLAAA